jgi:hypothetical protein
MQVLRYGLPGYNSQLGYLHRFQVAQADGLNITQR